MKNVCELEKKVSDFLLNKASNPFLKKTKIIIFESLEEDQKIIKNILTELFNNIAFYSYKDVWAVFISDKIDYDINSLFITLSADIGYDILVHDGIYINNSTNSSDIIDYLDIYCSANKERKYCDLGDLALMVKPEDYFKLLEIISRSNFKYIYKDVMTIDIINALIKNNLNVLQTSKVLYIHRNSVLNKIDLIYKETGLNLQKFTNAYLVKQIMEMRKN